MTPKAIGVGCDVSSTEAAEAAVARVVEELGGIHVLVNNAGITRDNLLFKMTDEDWDLVIGVHLRGAFVMTRAAQKHFVEQKYGKILNLSSVSALGNRGQANYSAAKMGIQGFTRTLGIELGPFGDQRQRDRTGLHRHRDDRRDRTPAQDGAGGAAPASTPRPTRSAGWARPRTSPPRRRSCAATRRPTSPARRCTSTAAPSSAERQTGRPDVGTPARLPPSESRLDAPSKSTRSLENRTPTIGASTCDAAQ